jgi:hypothetical protein
MCTPLEAFLFALLAAVISCVGLFFTLASRFVTKAECDLAHKQVLSYESDIAGLCKDIKLIFRMLRAVVVNMDIPREELEKILNMKAD